MSTFEEDAKKLVDEFRPVCAGLENKFLNTRLSKAAAIKCVEKILLTNPVTQDGRSKSAYWKQIKKEIEKIQ